MSDADSKVDAEQLLERHKNFLRVLHKVMYDIREINIWNYTDGDVDAMNSGISTAFTILDTFIKENQ